MSLYGQTWKIDGVTAGMILRGSANGRYQVIIEREFAELPQIEAISWEKPVVEHLRSDRPNETGLPEGYGFDVVRITYDSATRSYTVELQVSSQYLGDVSAYQAQMAQLQSQADALTQQAAAAQAQVTQATQEAQEKENGLMAAYREGVESGE